MFHDAKKTRDLVTWKCSLMVALLNYQARKLEITEILLRSILVDNILHKCFFVYLRGDIFNCQLNHLTIT